MKVRIIDDRHVAGYGLMQKGDEPDLPDALAKQLVHQQIAVVVAAKSKSAIRSKKED